MCLTLEGGECLPFQKFVPVTAAFSNVLKALKGQQLHNLDGMANAEAFTSNNFI
jgi:hypothetical protein